MSEGFLLLNIGNTHTGYVFANADGELLMPMGEADTAQWMQDLSLLPECAADITVWVACVVPPARKLLAESGKYADLHFVDAAAGERVGLDFSGVDSSTLGADRIANAVAMLDLNTAAACFDCGTAVTMEIIQRGGYFVGGAIAPGRKLMRRSLALGTAALPDLPLNNSVPDTPGTSTMEALAVGINGAAAAGMMRELIRVARAAGAVRLLAAGGDAEFFCRRFSELENAGKLFTLRGIAFIGVKHRQKM